MKEQNRAATGRQLERVAVEDFRAFAKGQLGALLRPQAIGYVRALLEEEMDELCGPAFSHISSRVGARSGCSQQKISSERCTATGTSRNSSTSIRSMTRSNSGRSPDGRSPPLDCHLCFQNNSSPRARPSSGKSR